MNRLASAFPTYPPDPGALPTRVVRDGAYELAFVRSLHELDDVQQLRFAIFNLELNEGFESAYASGRDRDEYDAQCHHLVVRHIESRRAVGTYRMQTARMARCGRGFYSAQEFDFKDVPDRVLNASIEIGRACIEREHRSLQVLYLLWKGLGEYAAWNRARYLFGCCSLTSQDTEEGRRVFEYLHAHGHVQDDFAVEPRPGFECGSDPVEAAPVQIPRLMRVYLTLGARIGGPPAIDRAFRTIDYLAFIDLESLDRRRLAFYGLDA